MKPALPVALLSAVLVGTAAWSVEDKPSPEPIGVSISEQEGYTIHQAIVPGELVDWTPISSGQDPPTLALLLEMEDESRQLTQWRLDGPTAGLEEMGPPLAEGADRLISWSPSGADGVRVLVAAEGTLWGLGAGGEWQARFESAYDLHPVRDHSNERSAGDDQLVLRGVGLLQGLVPDPVAGLRSSWRLELPLQVDREWGGLRLRTPPVVILDRDAAGRAPWVLGPEAQGRRRLRTLLITASEDGEPQVAEAWNLLPNAEEIHESWYVRFNSRPSLIVTSVMAEKHGVFEKKKLRLFELTTDRTRAGSGPLLEAMTKSRNWYGTCAGIVDLNRDGLDDVISAQPKGLGAGSLWVEAHIGNAGGGFEGKPWGSELEVDEGEHCTLANDLDGDGRVELWVVEGNSFLVFPIAAQPSVKGVVDDDPRWRLTFHDLDGAPQPVRLFGSVGSQVLLAGHTEGRRQVLRVVRFH